MSFRSARHFGRNRKIQFGNKQTNTDNDSKRNQLMLQQYLFLSVLFLMNNRCGFAHRNGCAFVQICTFDFIIHPN